MRQRHHRPGGVRLLRRGGARVPPGGGGDHQPGGRVQLLPRESLRWVQQEAVMDHASSTCGGVTVQRLAVQCVTRVCASCRLLRVNMARDGFRTTGRTPAVPTTCAVRFRSAQQQKP